MGSLRSGTLFRSPRVSIRSEECLGWSQSLSIIVSFFSRIVQVCRDIESLPFKCCSHRGGNLHRNANQIQSVTKSNRQQLISLLLVINVRNNLLFLSANQHLRIDFLIFSYSHYCSRLLFYLDLKKFLSRVNQDRKVFSKS